MYKDIALLIIDVQVSMFSSINNTSVHDSDKVLDNICLLIGKARNSGLHVIFIQHTNNEDEEYAEGKRTWQLHPRLQPLDTEKVIQKSIRDSFYNTTLLDELNKYNIKKLVITGMQTEYCMNSTILRAMELGYECIVAEDAHSTFNRSDISAEQIIKQHNKDWNDRNINLIPAQEIEFGKLML